MDSDKLGLVHIYCGDGKGKTTCSMGLCIRAIGSGLKVIVVQFLKDGDSSELNIIRDRLGATVIAGKGVQGFAFNMSDEQKQICKDTHMKNFYEAVGLCEEQGINLLILDESIGAMDKGLLDENVVLEFIKNKPQNLEVVLTGRNPSDKLKEVADYISEVKKIKHPFDKGINARKGIEK